VVGSSLRPSENQRDRPVAIGYNMPMADEIMQELWSIKDAIAEEADYDLDKLCQRLKDRQSEEAKKSPAANAVREPPES